MAKQISKRMQEPASSVNQLDTESDSFFHCRENHHLASDLLLELAEHIES